MRDCIVNFSTWAEDNSGQIQILIAIGAIYFAYKAYIKVLEQIEISLEQNRKGNEQRALDLKIKILDELFKSLEMGRGIEVGSKELVFECELLKHDLENEKDRDNKTSIKSFENIITTAQANIKQIKLNNDNLVDLIRNGAESDVLELENLSQILTKSILLRELDIKTHSDQKSMRIDIKKYRSTMSD